MNILTTDKNDQKIILSSSREHQIMMEWEKAYMEACIQKLQPFGDVLEIGFGLGYSATEIQKFSINSYTIIECDKDTYHRALKWKENYNHPINVVFGRWENFYYRLPKFDCVFFDDYDVKTVELCKINKKIPCRNITFFNRIKNNLKNYFKYSFYCALDEKDIKKYKTQWKNNLKFDYKNISFDKYKIEIPKNCKYAKNKFLYCPLIEVKKVNKYF